MAFSDTLRHLLEAAQEGNGTIPIALGFALVILVSWWAFRSEALTPFRQSGVATMANAFDANIQGFAEADPAAAERLATQMRDAATGTDDPGIGSLDEHGGEVGKALSDPTIATPMGLEDTFVDTLLEGAEMTGDARKRRISHEELGLDAKAGDTFLYDASQRKVKIRRGDGRTEERPWP